MIIVKSPSDPNGTNGGLTFKSIESATNHLNNMNRLLEEYDTNPVWNKDFWKDKPQQWIIVNT